MSATSLAGLVVTSTIAAILAAGAFLLVWWNRRAKGPSASIGLAAVALGLFAVLVFGVGSCSANGNAPNRTDTPYCYAGTYYTGATDGSARCVPYPPGVVR